jgi:hypothetical protein
MPFYDEDGHEVHPDFVPMPDLCRECKNNDDLKRYIFCEMRRIQRQHDNVFICSSFVPISPEFKEERLS